MPTLSDGVALEQLIATCLMTPRSDPRDQMCVWGLPLNIVGVPGCGKSERITAACGALGLPIETVLPSTKQPEDFSGAPFATSEGVELKCILPQANSLMAQRYGVLFIDELSTARPAVQSACLGIVHDRRIGDFSLPTRVRTLTAMNPPECAAGGYVLEAPMANRLMHIEYNKPTPGEWIRWFTGQSADHLSSLGGKDSSGWLNAELRVINGWPKKWPGVEAIFAGYIKSAPDKLHVMPKPNHPDASGAWPSPRMWNWASKAVATARCLGMPKSIETDLVAGCIGEGTATEWAEWVRKADLPDPEKMLTNGWSPNINRLDITMASLIGMTSWLKNHEDAHIKKQLAVTAWSIVEATADAGLADIAVQSASALVTYDLGMNSGYNPLAAASQKVMLKLEPTGVAAFAGDLP